MNWFLKQIVFLDYQKKIIVILIDDPAHSSSTPGRFAQVSTIQPLAPSFPTRRGPDDAHEV